MLEEKVRVSKAVADDLLSAVEQKDLRIHVLEAALQGDAIKRPSGNQNCSEADVRELTLSLAATKAELQMSRQSEEALSKRIAVVSSSYESYKISLIKAQSDVDGKVAVLNSRFEEESEWRVQAQRQILSGKETFLNTIKSMNARVEALSKEIEELKSGTRKSVE